MENYRNSIKKVNHLYNHNHNYQDDNMEINVGTDRELRKSERDRFSERDVNDFLVPEQQTVFKSTVNDSPQIFETSYSKLSAIPTALLDQIRQGKILKKIVIDKDQSTNATASQTSDDSKETLLDQIKRGINLKSVERNPKKPTTLYTIGLPFALAKALEERYKASHQTDDSSSDKEDDKDWYD